MHSLEELLSLEVSFEMPELQTRNRQADQEGDVAESYHLRVGRPVQFLHLLFPCKHRKAAAAAAQCCE